MLACTLWSLPLPAATTTTLAAGLSVFERGSDEGWLLVYRLGAIICLSGQICLVCVRPGVLFACLHAVALAQQPLPLLGLCLSAGRPLGTTAFLPPTASAGLGGCCCGDVVVWWQHHAPSTPHTHSTTTLVQAASAPCLQSLVSAASRYCGWGPIQRDVLWLLCVKEKEWAHSSACYQ